MNRCATCHHWEQTPALKEHERGQCTRITPRTVDDLVYVAGVMGASLYPKGNFGCVLWEEALRVKQHSAAH